MCDCAPLDLQPVWQGLVEFSYTGLGFTPNRGGEKRHLHEVLVYDKPFDCIFYEEDAGTHWRPQGSYEQNPRFQGYNQILDDQDGLIDQRDYYVHVDGVGFFKNLEDYYGFLSTRLRARNLVEVWSE